MDLIDFIRGQFAVVQQQLDGVMQGIDDSQFNYEPTGALNTIRAAYMHILYAQDGYIQEIIQGKPRLWDSGGWSVKLGVEHAPGRGNWEAIKNKIVPLVPVYGYRDEVRVAANAYLATLDKNDLERRVKTMRGESTVGEVLGLFVTHTAGHTGEIATLKGIQGIK